MHNLHSTAQYRAGHLHHYRFGHGTPYPVQRPETIANSVRSTLYGSRPDRSMLCQGDRQVCCLPNSRIPDWVRTILATKLDPEHHVLRNSPLRRLGSLAVVLRSRTAPHKYQSPCSEAPVTTDTSSGVYRRLAWSRRISRGVRCSRELSQCTGVFSGTKTAVR